MNSRNGKTVLGLSIAAVMAIFVVSVSTMPDAFAKQEPQPDFVAKLQGKQQTVPEERGGGHGKASFWLTEVAGEPALQYKIEVSKNLYIEGAKGTGDLITKIHLHLQDPGTAGPHVLNIFGAPSEDDDHLVVDAKARTFSGTWDDADENFAAVDLDGNPNNPHVREGGDSVALNDFDSLTGQIPLDGLCDGKLYVNIHSEKHGPGALRGQIMPTSGVC